MRPWTIFSLMFSGFDWRSSFFISISLSRAIMVGSQSEAEMYSTSGHAAICIAMSLARSLNLSPRATKSVSQLTSTKTPILEPAWMYEKTPPSAAMRPCFLSAEAMPLTRNHSCAFWTSPLFSINAFLQSIIPAPDICLSSLTVAAEMAAPSAAGAAGVGSSLAAGAAA